MATTLRKMLADLTQAGVVRNVYHLETDSDCVYIGDSDTQTLSEVLTTLQKNRTITLTGDAGTDAANYVVRRVESPAVTISPVAPGLSFTQDADGDGVADNSGSSWGIWMA